MLTGGALGLREKYDTIISRVQSFGAYHFNINNFSVVSRLFQVILELAVISKPTRLRRKISIWIRCHTNVPVTYTRWHLGCEICCCGSESVSGSEAAS